MENLMGFKERNELGGDGTKFPMFPSRHDETGRFLKKISQEKRIEWDRTTFGYISRMECDGTSLNGTKRHGSQNVVACGFIIGWVITHSLFCSSCSWELLYTENSEKPIDLLFPEAQKMLCNRLTCTPE